MKGEFLDMYKKILLTLAVFAMLASSASLQAHADNSSSLGSPDSSYAESDSASPCYISYLPNMYVRVINSNNDDIVYEGITSDDKQCEVGSLDSGEYYIWMQTKENGSYQKIGYIKVQDGQIIDSDLNVENNIVYVSSYPTVMATFPMYGNPYTKYILRWDNIGMDYELLSDDRGCVKIDILSEKSDTATIKQINGDGSQTELGQLVIDDEGVMSGKDRLFFVDGYIVVLTEDDLIPPIEDIIEIGEPEHYNPGGSGNYDPDYWNFDGSNYYYSGNNNASGELGNVNSDEISTGQGTSDINSADNSIPGNSSGSINNTGKNVGNMDEIQEGENSPDTGVTEDIALLGIAISGVAVIVSKRK